MAELVKKNKGKKWIVIVVAVVALIAAIVVGSIFIVRAVNSNRARNEVTEGDRYLSELEYEEAIAHYLNAIEINPANFQAYEGIYSAYMGIVGASLEQANYDIALDYVSDALDVLNRGRDNFRDGSEEQTSIDDMIDSLKQFKKEIKAEREEAQEDSETDVPAPEEGNAVSEEGNPDGTSPDSEVVEEVNSLPQPSSISKTGEYGITYIEEYDEEGHLIKITQVDANDPGLVHSVEEFTYNPDGTIAESYEYYTRSDYSVYYAYEYDEYGEIIVKYDKDPLAMEYSSGVSYEYIRDDDGNIIMIKKFGRADFSQYNLIDQTEFVYENGKLVEKKDYTVFQPGGGMPEKFFTHSTYYDEKGLITQMVAYDSFFSEADVYTVVYEFDEEERPIHLMITRSDGMVYQEESYTY